MNNNLKQISKQLTSVLFLLAVILGCSSLAEDDYKKFTEGGEILYAGRLDSVKIFPGENRVQLKAQLSSDPKVTSYRVYWSNKKDSVVIPVTQNQIGTEITQIINGLEENIYNFQIQSFDNQGNSSVGVFATGRVYGARYRASLNNRPLLNEDIAFLDEAILLKFAPVDLTRGLVETEVEYIDKNSAMKSVVVKADNNGEVKLENFNIGNESYKYRSLFKPDSLSIDNFYTDFTVITPKVPEVPTSVDPYFKNASVPYELLETGGGRYATPTEWIHNSGALNHGGYGVLDTQPSNDIINLVTGYGGEPNIVNGKVYQRMRLPAGTYTYEVTTGNGNYNAVNDQLYFTAALGFELPNVSDVETSSNTLAFRRVSGGANTYQMDFTLTGNSTVISIGFALTNGIDPNDPNAAPQNINRFMTIPSFTLTKN